MFGESLDPIEVYASARTVQLYDSAATAADRKNNSQLSKAIRDVQDLNRENATVMGGWKAALFRVDGTVDLDLTLNPWCVEDQVSILKEKFRYQQRQFRDNMDQKNLEVSRLRALLLSIIHQQHHLQQPNSDNLWDKEIISLNLGVDTEKVLERDLLIFKRMKRDILSGKITLEGEVFYTDEDLRQVEKTIQDMTTLMNNLCSQHDFHIQHHQTTHVRYNEPHFHHHHERGNTLDVPTMTDECNDEDVVDKAHLDLVTSAASQIIENIVLHPPCPQKEIVSDVQVSKGILGKLRPLSGVALREPPLLASDFEMNFAKKSTVFPSSSGIGSNNLLTSSKFIVPLGGGGGMGGLPLQQGNTGSKSFLDQNVRTGWRKIEKQMRKDRSLEILHSGVKPEMMVVQPIPSQSSHIMKSNMSQRSFSPTRLGELSGVEGALAATAGKPMELFGIRPRTQNIVGHLKETCETLRSRILFGIRPTPQILIPSLGVNHELEKEMKSRGCYDALMEKEHKLRSAITQAEIENEILVYARQINSKINSHIGTVHDLEGIN